MSRTFVIRQAEDGYYSAAFGEQFAGELGFDECLGVVAAWLLKSPTPYTNALGDTDPLVEGQEQIGKLIEARVQIERDRREEGYRKMRETREKAVVDKEVPF